MKILTTLKFAKTREGAVIPSKREEDAGFDIYACIEDTLVIMPHTTEIVPSGIAAVCEPDYCLLLQERGSTGTKGIAQRCGVIDSGYRGEIMIPLTNTTDRPILLYNPATVSDTVAFVSAVEPIRYPTTKAITQAILVPVPTVEASEISYDELLAIPSERGTGRLGSSGK